MYDSTPKARPWCRLLSCNWHAHRPIVNCVHLPFNFAITYLSVHFHTLSTRFFFFNLFLPSKERLSGLLWNRVQKKCKTIKTEHFPPTNFFDTDDEGVHRTSDYRSEHFTAVPFLSVINKRPIVSIKSCVSSRVKGLCYPNCLNEWKIVLSDEKTSAIEFYV